MSQRDLTAAALVLLVIAVLAFATGPPALAWFCAGAGAVAILASR